jgi:hypothetical protein
MLKPTLFLRTAAVMGFIHAVLHTIGGVFGDLGPGPAATAVQAMKVNQFLVMGHARSYWDFYRGFGLAVTIFLTAEAVILWQLASLAKTDGRRLRPILAAFLVGYTALAVNSYAYFFVGPVIAEIFIACCLGLAMATIGGPVSSTSDNRYYVKLEGDNILDIP